MGAETPRHPDQPAPPPDGDPRDPVGRPRRRGRSPRHKRKGLSHAIQKDRAALRTDARTRDTLSARSASVGRSEEHTSELQSLMRISYAVFCLKKKKTNNLIYNPHLQQS